MSGGLLEEFQTDFETTLCDDRVLYDTKWIITRKNDKYQAYVTITLDKISAEAKIELEKGTPNIRITGSSFWLIQLVNEIAFTLYYAYWSAQKNLNEEE